MPFCCTITLYNLRRNNTMAINMVKLPTKKDGVNVRVCQGHFATGHSHINYYIDITMQKTRLSEARATAKAICESFRTDTIVDTILCLDNTEVIATCLAEELTKSDFRNMNAHQTIYVISPEFTADGRLLFRENIHNFANLLHPFPRLRQISVPARAITAQR